MTDYPKTLEVDVTTEDIAQAVAHNNAQDYKDWTQVCPVSVAASRALGVPVGMGISHFEPVGHEYEVQYLVPGEVTDWILDFDATYKAEPISFIAFLDRDDT